MKIARRIRTLSWIVLIINLIFCFVAGIYSMGGVSDETTPLILVPFFCWVCGPIIALLFNAVLQGFAEHIELTYAATCKAYGIPIIPEVVGATLEVSFWLPDPEDEEQWERYAKALHDNGYISEVEYENMI